MSAAWRGFRRLRIGRHRVIYAYEGRDLLVSPRRQLLLCTGVIVAGQVSVVRVGHRREVYR